MVWITFLGAGYHGIYRVFFLFIYVTRRYTNRGNAFSILLQGPRDWGVHHLMKGLKTDWWELEMTFSILYLLSRLLETRNFGGFQRWLRTLLYFLSSFGSFAMYI